MCEAETIDVLWRRALARVLHTGESVSPRGQPCREVRGLTCRLLNPDNNVLISRTRRLNYHFMVAEWLWMRFGHADVASIAAYNKQIAQFSDDGHKFFGAYGPLIQAQLPDVIKRLHEDKSSRQAVLSLWRPTALTHVTRDPPCTLTWQFFIRDGALEMHVHMRSNDLWLGFPYDVFNFTQMQCAIANHLELRLGPYVHHVGSLHLYESNVHAAQQVLAADDADIPEELDGFFGLPEPVYPEPFQLDMLLVNLANRSMEDDTARDVIKNLEPRYQPYGQILLHRFTKNGYDLTDPTLRALLHRKEG